MNSVQSVELSFTGVREAIKDYPVRSYDLVSNNGIIGACAITNTELTAKYYAEINWGPTPIIGDSDAWFAYIRLFDEFQGKGFGTPVYTEAIKLAQQDGLRFRSDPDCVSPSAMQIWSKLIRNGQAEELIPFEVDSEGDYISGLVIARPRISSTDFAGIGVNPITPA